MRSDLQKGNSSPAFQALPWEAWPGDDTSEIMDIVPTWSVPDPEAHAPMEPGAGPRAGVH
eukprot:1664347-Amphidinium_carterae.2